MHITTAKFDRLYGPEAHVARITDIGAVRVDLDGDQPPFTGLIFKLEHRELIGAPFEMLFRLPDELLPTLFDLLAAHLSAAEIPNPQGEPDDS